MVTVTPHEPEETGKRKLGTLTGQILISEDIDTMYQDEIIRMFGGVRGRIQGQGCNERLV